LSLARRWRRLRSLDLDQWRTLLVSLVLLPAIQLALRVRGFTWTARVLAARSDAPARPPDGTYARRAAEAVAIVGGRRLVGARCLGRSLLLWFLLRRRGTDAELVIGADAVQAGSLPAHAWVEVDGVPVNDVPEVRQRFGSFEIPLPRLRPHHVDRPQRDRGP
jgi:hypothetical protein